MEWDSKLEGLFNELNELLHPDHIVDISVIYSTFKKMRDIMLRLAEVVNNKNEK